MQGDKGFTIIETLVAIAILMISIVGPLTIAHKGLLAALYAHDQVTASYLAQDAMEYIKNVRDNNLINRPEDWLNKLDTCEDKNCSVDTITGVPNDTNPTAAGIVPCSSNCNLYLSTTNGYTMANSGNTKTKFSRYFFLTKVNANGGNTVGNTVGNEYTATVIVSWKNGTISQEVKYESQLFNVIR